MKNSNKNDMDYLVDTYQKWLNDNVKLSNAFSPNSLRILTHHLLMGRNYRLITENNTKSKLFYTYLWISDVVKNAKVEYGNEWKEKVVTDLFNLKKKGKEQNQLLYWLIGVTSKTSTNLGISRKEIPSVLTDLINHITDQFNEIGRFEDVDDTWLMLISGAATLNIRGSEKSKIGKSLEKVFIRAALSIIGLQENTDFWTNIQRDTEVDRETDAEVATQRARIRIEVGLISSGNQEVTEDKIGRVGRNGMIIFDKVGSKTKIYNTADSHLVKLVQIRNNQPLVEIYRHLSPLVNRPLTPPPTIESELLTKVNELPDEIFKIELKRNSEKKQKGNETPENE